MSVEKQGASILDLDMMVSTLPEAERTIFERIYRVSVVEGRLNPPENMRTWIEKQFGSVQATQSQKVIKVTNMITWEGTLFNGLRASRPIEARGESELLERLLREANDPLEEPLKNTPEDVFGRVEGRHCITASNIAKYDGFHSLVVFKEHSPLNFCPDRVADYIDTAQRWAEMARREDPSAKYFFFMWNCLWRAGASLSHGHAQVSLGRDMHYAKVEHTRRSALSYRDKYGQDYFKDLFRVHTSLGCGFAINGARLMASLTPIKEKEVILMGSALDGPFKKLAGEVLVHYRDLFGVKSFNLVICMPPLGETNEVWDEFPVLLRLVDRGDENSHTSDMGAMELYAQSVVASDPFKVAEALRGSILGC